MSTGDARGAHPTDEAAPAQPRAALLLPSPAPRLPLVAEGPPQGSLSASAHPEIWPSLSASGMPPPMLAQPHRDTASARQRAAALPLTLCLVTASAAALSGCQAKETPGKDGIVS